MEENKAEFELSEVEVDTIGLVTRGAIGEDFFLTKAKDGETVEDETVVEVVDPGSDGFWAKMKKLFVGAVEEMEVAKASAEPEVVKAEDPPEPEEDDKEDEKENMTCEKSKEEPVMSDETVVAQPTTIDVDALISKIEKSVADKYDAEMGALKERLEKAEDFEWLMATFTAVDKQLGAAGILSEFGTSKTPDELALEDKVEKIAKEQKISYTDALLTLPEAEQEQLLAQMRK